LNSVRTGAAKKDGGLKRIPTPFGSLVYAPKSVWEIKSFLGVAQMLRFDSAKIVALEAGCCINVATAQHLQAFAGKRVR
jgi:hypothetical protein